MAWIILVAAILLAVLFLVIIKRVPFPEHWIVDRMGRLVEKSPGYCIMLPIIDRLYARVKTGIDYSITLFGEEKEHSIDLTIGGRIRLTSPQVWISVKAPKTTVTEALDFERQISSIAEHRLAGAINLLTPEEVLVMRAPKPSKEEKSAAKDLLVKKIDETVGGSKKLKNFLGRIQVDYRGITLADFDFEEGLRQKREERVTTGLDITIGKNRGEARQNEMSAIGETAKALEAKGFPSLVAQQISAERYQDHLAAEKGTLQKIIWQGGGGISEIAAQWQKGTGLLTAEITPTKGPTEKATGELGTGPTTGSKTLTEEDLNKIDEEIDNLPKEQRERRIREIADAITRGDAIID